MMQKSFFIIESFEVRGQYGMNKKYYDLYYEILSHYLNFPDVADTFKSIKEGILYLINYPQDEISFMYKQNDLIFYIVQARTDNLVYNYYNKKQIPMSIGMPSKSLWQINRFELFENLETAVLWLKLKGMHQLIKHYNTTIDDSALAGELLQSDMHAIAVRHNIS